MAVVKRLTRRIVAPLLEGSIPSSHPIIIRFLSLGRSQVGKARDFDSRMRWFESSRPSQCDPLAQSVEHLTFNQGVPRSSRGWITIFLSIKRCAHAGAAFFVFMLGAINHRVLGATWEQLQIK